MDPKYQMKAFRAYFKMYEMCYQFGLVSKEATKIALLQRTRRFHSSNLTLDKNNDS